MSSITMHNNVLIVNIYNELAISDKTHQIFSCQKPEQKPLIPYKVILRYI